jgi:dienelactone hydrolase
VHRVSPRNTSSHNHVESSPAHAGKAVGLVLRESAQEDAVIKPIDLSENAPWKQRIRVAYILRAPFARTNPARGLVVHNKSGSFQLYAWDTTSGELRQLTNRSSNTLVGWIPPDGQHIYFLNDQQGNEQGHLTRVPFEGGEFEDVTPNLPLYTLRGVCFSRNSNLLAFDAVNADGFQLYVMTLGAHGELGEPHLIYRSEKEAWGALLSSDGTMAAMQSTARAGGQRHRSILAIDTTDGHLVNETWDGPEADIEIATFSPLPHDQRILAMTSRGEFRRPFIWDPCTNERIDLACKELEGDVLAVDWSPDGSKILLCQINRAQQRLYIYNLTTQQLTYLEHPDGVVYVTGLGIPGEIIGPEFVLNEEIWGKHLDSTRPPNVEAFDAFTGKLKHTLLKVDDVPLAAVTRSIAFPSSDGQEVQAWLALPDGQPPFPTVLFLHGGPHGAQMNYFLGEFSSWTDHGIALCRINYRGSTTFGRKFKEQIWGDIGHWELEDIVAARAWLVDQRISTPDAIFLNGVSYGGFLTLLALGRQPELWAGGMPWAAAADMIATYEDSSDALKSFWAGLFGGTPTEKREQYIASSPITYAESVQAPVLIIQGRNDTRTPARQMEMYEAKMKSLGKDLEVLWYEAGHTGIDKEQTIEFQEKELLFVERVLNGRR